jgi:hypothetical protein
MSIIKGGFPNLIICDDMLNNKINSVTKKNFSSKNVVSLKELIATEKKSSFSSMFTEDDTNDINIVGGEKSSKTKIRYMKGKDVKINGVPLHSIIGK